MYKNLAENCDMVLLEKKTISAIGLARRAGKLEVGAEMCEEAVRAGKAVLCVMASDLSGNTSKKLHDCLKYRNVPYIKLSIGKGELAKILGKSAVTVSCVITDKGFASIIYKALGIDENNSTQM